MSVTLGLDFDNTIVTYDAVFHRHAMSLGLIGGAVRANKKDIRDAIRLQHGGEEKWIRLQALVYGVVMDEAELAEGIEGLLYACRERDIKVSIISHKTVYPALGPQVNLRDAARKWLRERGFYTRFGLKESDVVFVGTLAEKLAEISSRGCTHFVDDLVEVLIHQNFPKDVHRILYSPAECDSVPEGVTRYGSWRDIHGYFFG